MSKRKRTKLSEALRGKSLSPAELDALLLKGEGGHSTETAAKMLKIEPKSLEARLYRAYQKLGVHSLHDAVRVARGTGQWPRRGASAVTLVQPKGHVVTSLSIPLVEAWAARELSGSPSTLKRGLLTSNLIAKLKHVGVLYVRDNTLMLTAPGAALVAAACVEDPRLMEDGIALEAAALWQEFNT